MRKLKQLLLFPLCLSALFALSACGATETADAEQLSQPFQARAAAPSTSADPVANAESYMSGKPYNGYAVDSDGEVITVSVWKQNYERTRSYLVAMYISEKYDGEHDLHWDWIKENCEQTASEIEQIGQRSGLPTCFNVYSDETRETLLLSYESGALVYDMFRGYEDLEAYEAYQATLPTMTVQEFNADLSARKMAGQPIGVQASPAQSIYKSAVRSTIAGGASGYLGSYYVKINNAVLTTGYDGKSVIVVSYTWTNNSSETTTAGSVFYERAFQDGIELDQTVSPASYVSNYATYLRPGASIEVKVTFTLRNTSSQVEFEMFNFLEYIDGNNEALGKAFTIS